MKEEGVDSPIIKTGKNLKPEKFIKSFKDYSPEAQANIKQLAKENNFVIQTKSEPLKNVVSSLQKNRPLKSAAPEIDKLLKIPGVTTADQLPIPEKTKTRDMFKKAFTKGAKTAGKIIKPLGVGFGVNAVKTAITKANEQGLDLNFADKVMAFDSGDAEIALNNARRRVDPEFAAQERAKDLAQMTDDFEEVGQSTFGKFNDQIKNIKLP